MTRKCTLTRLVPAALLTSAALLACNRQGEAPTPPPSADRMDALVLGQVQSTYLDALKPNLNLVQYTGSQKVDDYDLLVFDGDAQDPQTLRAEPLVDQALRGGKWVLGLDVNEDHKRTGLGARLGFASRSTSPGWLVRTARDEHGRPAVWVVDAPKVNAAPTATTLVGVKAGLTAQANANAYANIVMSRLRAPPTTVRDTPIPPNLILKTYYYTATTSYHFTGSYRTAGQQTAAAQYNYVFNVYLDNSNNPQGNFQWVAVDIDATGNPTSGTGTFSNMVTEEKAWFLDRQTVAVKPVAADDALFTSVGSSPATANGVTSVTTGTSFTVGFTGQVTSGGSGGIFNGSYTYTNEQTRSIQDWKLTNQGSGNAFSWYYRSNNPLDADGSYSCYPNACTSAWTQDASSGGLPKQPNDIAVTQLQLHTQGAWKTSSVQSRWVTFDAQANQGLADLFCKEYYPDLNTCPHRSFWGEKWPDNQRVDVPHTEQLQVNLASVVPIPISSITFGAKNAPAGSPVTGTITLASPAVEDTDITLVSSDPQHATVLPKVTVKQGEASATFQVLTTSNGGAPGSTFGVTIQAFYAQYYQAQLTLQNVSVASLTLDPAAIRIGQSSTGTVTLNQAQSVDTGVPLTSSSPNVVVPAQVTVPRSQTSVTFPLKTLLGGPGGGGVTITAGNAQAQLAVQSPAVYPVVSAGGEFVCAVDTGGVPVCWGDNTDGEVTLPVGISAYKQVDAGGDNACGVKGDGGVACWGNLSQGLPSVPAGLSGVTDVSVGDYNACALKSDGSVVCWGSATNSVPGGLFGVTQVSLGADGGGGGCVLKNNGSVLCWNGIFWYGTTPGLDVPAGLPPIKQVSAGNSYACALKNNGTVVCWGDDETSGVTTTPAGLSSVVQVSAGDTFACALKNDGTVVCWGTSTTGANLTPPASLNDVVQISAGDSNFTCALKNDGVVVCWGYNGQNQATPPAGLNLLKP